MLLCYTGTTRMYALVMAVHVVVCVFLIIVVLLQSGKAADLAGAFGGMGSQTAFGPRGSATLLSKATTISAVLFMVTSLSLSMLAARGTGYGSTVLEGTPSKAPAPVQTQVPQAPQVPGQVTVPMNTTDVTTKQVPADAPGEIKQQIDLKNLKIPNQPPADQKSAPPAPTKK
jgi:preprotein translocase subunit SecG